MTGLRLRGAAVAIMVTLLTLLAFFIANGPPWTRVSAGARADLELSAADQAACLSLDRAVRPVWECYEVSADLPPGSAVIVEHAGGEQHRTMTFGTPDGVRFRFTPTRPGVWTFSSGGEVRIAAERPAYAKGFVQAHGHYWTRSATGEAFVPQYVMYDKPDITAGLREFVLEHGFTGFHVQNLRDFLRNPEYFESVVLNTYRLGGVTHFWIWGDAARGQTPDTYGVDVDRLYREIAARLGPVPGWTVGFGFDLFEWVTADMVEHFQKVMADSTSYRHMLGARGHKNEYRGVVGGVDYASWEWHRPGLSDYREHLHQAQGKPAFSEDRFRVRVNPRFAYKDYDFEDTVAGLWNSVLAGGVANIWGHQPPAQQFSAAYPVKDQIRTYAETVSRYYSLGMNPVERIFDRGDCLGGPERVLCRAEGVSVVVWESEAAQAPPSVVAIDAAASFREIELPLSDGRLQFPRASDWIVVVAR